MGGGKSKEAKDLEEYSRKINKIHSALCLLNEKSEFVTLNHKMMELLGLSPMLQVSEIPNHKPHDYFPKKFGVVSEIVVGTDVVVETFDHALDRVFKDPLGRTFFYWCHEFHSSGDVVLSEVLLMSLTHNDEIYAQAAVRDIANLSLNPEVQMKDVHPPVDYDDGSLRLASKEPAKKGKK